VARLESLFPENQLSNYYATVPIVIRRQALYFPTMPSSPAKRTASYQYTSRVQSSKRILALALLLRGVLLFAIGMGYGLLVRHLHTDRKVASFQVEGIIKPRNDWRYLLFWGLAGVGLGSALPWVDTLFLDSAEEEKRVLREIKSAGGGIGGRSGSVGGTKEVDSGKEEGIWGADWTPAVRSVGAFVGISYAIRKLPWSSPLQASLTLALVNPVLWYLIDRSRPGLLLSTAVGATGTILLLASNPDMMPSPAFGRNTTTTYGGSTGEGMTEGSDMRLGTRRESIEGAVWILSVLFCSCVCFGNIGRRLALRGGGVNRR